jgi:predicted transcriptional regulator
LVERTTIMAELRITTADDAGEGALALDDDALSRALSPTSLELLRAIAAEEPGSIRATAGAVGRDVKNVHENLMALSRIGVVELEWDGNARRPRVPYDELVVSVPLRGESDPDSSGDG